mmetsp:Transcript_41161/g.74036  ORF Transcript_41161/g.74036 Transcript_41161/m.74036 type:complete len:110 (+) Transcript_41161:626-955(+)
MGSGAGRPQTGRSMTYEEMVSLDRSNVKRGVRPHVLKQLSRGRARGPDALHKCGICLGELGQAACTLRLPCHHDFCEHCAREWLKNHHTCPVCRFEFPERDTQVIHWRQ